LTSVKLLSFTCFFLLCIPSLIYAQDYSTKVGNQTINIIVKPNNTVIVDTQKIEQLIQQLEQKNHTDWTQGDVIIASSTITAFFGFGSFLVIRFENRRKDAIKSMMKQMNAILISVFLVQFLHIIVIISVMMNFFNQPFYSTVLIYTIGLLFIIFVAIRKVLEKENEIYEKTGKATSKFKSAENNIMRQKNLSAYAENKIQGVMNKTEEIQKKNEEIDKKLSELGIRFDPYDAGD
jgi:uncharacterized membrane protein YqjE